MLHSKANFRTLKSCTFLLNKKSAAKKIKILDGGTGTEIEKRLKVKDLPGNAASSWVAAAHLSHPELVKSVHKSYIKAGAEIITANTYATNKHVLTAAGLGDQTENAIRIACNLAREAICDSARCDSAKSDSGVERKIKIAGSLSCHPPAVELIDGCYIGQWPDSEQEFQNYKEAFKILIDEKVDLILIELMKDLEHSPLLLQAVADEMFARKKAGLDCPPVQLGIATRRSKDGQNICLFEKSHEIIFNQQLLNLFLNFFKVRRVCLDGVNIMHTNFSDIEPSIEIVKSGWEGKIGCYPDHGYYKVPEWVFKDVNIETALEFVKVWEKQGVSMVGGCCGIGPEFISAIAEKFGK